MKSYTLDDLARMIDHTNLHTDASPKDMEVIRDILKYMNIQEHAKQRSPIRQLEKLRQLKKERQKML